MSKCYGNSRVGTKFLQSSLTDRYKGPASQVTLGALRRMCFCKTVFGGSQRDFSNETLCTVKVPMKSLIVSVGRNIISKITFHFI